MKLKRWGVTLILIGLGSYVLPMIGLQFRLLNLFGNNLSAGIVIAAAGGVLLAMGFIKDRVLSAPAGKPTDSHKERRVEAQRASQPQRQLIKGADARCSECGAENAQGDQFCGSCGAALLQAASPDAPNCVRCGALLPPDEHYCGECGAPRGSSSAALPIPAPTPVSRPSRAAPTGVARLVFFGLTALAGILVIVGVIIALAEANGDPSEKALVVWITANFLLLTSLVVLFPKLPFQIFFLISTAVFLSGVLFVWRYEFALRQNAPYWADLATVTGPFSILGALIGFAISKFIIT